MRVVHVVSSLDPRTGGPAVAIAGLARVQQAQGLHVSIFNCFDFDDLHAVADALQADGIGVEEYGPYARFGAVERKMKARLESRIANSDIVHIHALWEEVQHQAAIRAFRHGKPYIFRPCGMLDPWSLSQGRLKKKIYMALRLNRDLNRAAAIHYTAGDEERLAAPLRLKPRSIVEPNGINLEEFAQIPDAGMFQRRWPEVRDRRIVLFLSRLHHKKGLDLLLPAFAEARPHNTVLVIAGPDNDNYRPVLDKLIQQFNLENDVIFTGILRGAERIEAFAAADIFALPSYQENFGIVVVEALATGTPVIISDQVNIHHEISAAGVGAVVPTQIDELAQTLKRWMSDESLRTAAKRRAREFAFRTYDWNAIAGRWAEHYRRLIASADSSA